jgi:cytochrome c oxidase subunit III
VSVPDVVADRVGREVIPIQEARARDVITSSVGMVIFLGAWTMMFAALFFVYLMLRARAPMWPPDHFMMPLVLPSINTLIIAISSVTLHMGAQAARGTEPQRFGRWLWASVALGTVFIGLQTVVWLELWQTGFTLTSGMYGSVFYLLTVFHALHVLCGLGVLFSLVPTALRPALVPRRQVRIRLVAMFWHFVGVVWLFMFLSVYVL